MRKPSSNFWTLHHHDARSLDRLLSAHSTPQRPLLTATITSPPYGSLKDYGHTKQIGFGQRYDDYLDEMQGVFQTLHTHTRVDGSLWLIADTYMSKGQAPRSLVPVPFDLSAVAEAAGWTLRDVIIWQKDRTLPWSNGTRLRNAFEYVLLLVKGPQPKYYLDRLRSHLDSREWWVRFPERYNPKGKAPSNVWDIPIPVQGSWGNGEIEHSCPLPPALVERLLLLSSDVGDVICDPFAGSGVVIAESERLGRRGLGSEIVERHIDEFQRIVRPEVMTRDSSDSPNNGDASSVAAQLLVNLRLLKYPVVLMRRAAKHRDVPWPLCAFVFPDRSRALTNGYHGALRVVFIVDGNAACKRTYRELVCDMAKQPPASKFGLRSKIEVVGTRSLARLVRGRRIYLYSNGSTSRAVRPVPHRELATAIDVAREDSTPPVFSNLHVDVAPRSSSALIAS
jgi:DNA modification methylase